MAPLLRLTMASGSKASDSRPDAPVTKICRASEALPGVAPSLLAGVGQGTSEMDVASIISPGCVVAAPRTVVGYDVMGLAVN